MAKIEKTLHLIVRFADSLFDVPILTIPQAQRLLGVTYRSAQRNVEKLLAAGILQQESEISYGKSRLFVAPEILRILAGEEP